MGYFEDSINNRFDVLHLRLENIEARLDKLENPSPCTYEVRSRNVQYYHVSREGSGGGSGGYNETAVWCHRHGWDCPNASRRVVRK